MSRVETHELIRVRSGATVVPDHLLSLLHDRARGNPFFTEDYSRPSLSGER
jgi:hypothetical protein